MRDLCLLKTLGRDLDFRPSGAVLRGHYVFPVGSGMAPPQMRDYLIAGLLKVRSKKKGLVRLTPNRAQMEYARRCTQRNIVLKARQLGVTTYVAARFFLNDYAGRDAERASGARPALSGRNFHDRASLPGEPAGAMRKGALVTSRANVRQIVFPNWIASIGWKRRGTPMRDAG